jgi:hypothetical protein
MSTDIVTAMNAGLIGLLAGAGLGAGLTWLGLGARSRALPAKTARARSGAGARAGLARLTARPDVHPDGRRNPHPDVDEAGCEPVLASQRVRVLISAARGSDRGTR